MKIAELIEQNSVEAISILYYLGDKETEKSFDEIKKKFFSDGKWREFGYKEHDDEYGYWGVIPACFWIIALNNKNNKDQSDFAMLHQSINFLLESEKNGRLRKTQYNRNDVINTNLLAAYAIHKFAETLNSESYLYKVAECTIRRIVYHALISQNSDGSFPYQSNSNHISIVYHFMVHALLMALSNKIDNFIMQDTLNKSDRFIEKIHVDGKILWDLDTSGDKIGILWANAWMSACCLKNTIYEKEICKYIEDLRKYRKFSPSNVPRDIAWCLLANWVKDDAKQISCISKSKLKFINLAFFRIKQYTYRISKISSKIITRFNNIIFTTGHEPRI